MPSGKTHDRVTLWSLPWLVGGSFIVTRSGELTLLVAGGYLFSGLMFGPDLDIHSVQYKRWGVFRPLWLPYQKALRHRSKLSHGVLIGTVLRVVYLLTWLLFFG
ncbi:MAG: metal-binding protein, partial [Jaaginema sp. PMC 1079.18]|nr:metal-binding protein [Jaaginema sp. PMC 1079.18]